MIIFILILLFVIGKIVFLIVFDYNVSKNKMIQNLRSDVSRIFPNISKLKIYPGKSNFTRNKKNYLSKTN